MRSPLQFATVAALLVSLSACSRPSQMPAGKPHSEARSNQHSGARDLGGDEARGGHTLKRHVGRTDAELRERLRREHSISAASTYTDRRTAEDFIGECLTENQGRLMQWLDRENHPNLVLDCQGDPAWPIGKTIHRGSPQIEACSKATVVVKFDPPHGYYVLTSYPDCQ